MGSSRIDERLRRIAETFVAHPGSKRAAAELHSSLSNNAKVTVLQGRKGVGKTELIKAMARGSDDLKEISRLADAPYIVALRGASSRDFHLTILNSFGVPTSRPHLKSRETSELILSQISRNDIKYIVVDEADNLIQAICNVDQRQACLFDGVSVRWLLIGRSAALVEALEQKYKIVNIVSMHPLSITWAWETVLERFLAGLHAAAVFGDPGELDRGDVVQTIMTASRGMPSTVKRIVMAAALRSEERKKGRDAIVADDVFTALADARW